MSQLRARLASMPEESRRFALMHLAYHLHRSRQHEALYRLIDESWQNAHIAETHSTASFAADVALAVDLAARRYPADIAELWRATIIAVHVRAAATQISPRVMRMLAQLGRHEQAVGYAVLVENPAQRCRSCVAIGEVLYEQGRRAAVIDILKLALAAAVAEQPVVTRTSCCASVAGLAARAGADDVVSASVAALLAAKRGHWTPKALSDLVPHLVAGGRRDDLNRLTVMVRGFPDDGDSNPLADTAATIADGLAASGMTRELRDLFEDVNATMAAERRTLTLAKVVPALGKIADRESIDRAATRATDEVSSWASMTLQKGLAAAYALVGDEQRSSEWSERVKLAEESTMSPDVRASNQSSELARLGRYDDAARAARTILQPQVRSQAFRSIGRIALGAGDVVAGAAMAQDSMSAARLVDPDDIFAENWQAPVEAVVQAAELLWDVGKPACTGSETLKGTTVAAEWQAAARSSAVAAATDMLGATDYLCDSTYGPDMLKVVMRILGEAREIEHLEEAIKVAEAIDDSTFREDAIEAAVRALADAGAVTRALELAARYQFAANEIVAERLMANGEHMRAASLIDDTLLESATVAVANDAAISFRAIAEAFVALSMYNDARDAALEALAAAKRMQVTSHTAYLSANGDKAVALARCAGTLARLGDIDAALVAARDAIEEANPKRPRVRSSIRPDTWRLLVKRSGRLPEVLRECASVFARAGRSEEFKDIEHRLLDDSDRGRVVEAIHDDVTAEIVKNGLDLDAWRDACVKASTLDLANVHRLLGSSARLLGRIDAGTTLSLIFRYTLAVSAWGTRVA